MVPPALNTGKIKPIIKLKLRWTMRNIMLPAASRSLIPTTAHSHYSFCGFNWTKIFTAWNQEVWPLLLSVAAAHLDAAQLERYRRHLEQQADMMRVTAAMGSSTPAATR